MTCCEEVGLKVGDKIRYLGDNRGSRHSVFNYGDVITLVEDLGNVNCLFSKDSHDRFYFDLENRAWERMIDEPTVVTKDTIVNVELTWEEVVNLKFLAGKSNFMKVSCWDKLSNLITEQLNPDVESQVGIPCDVKLKVPNPDYYQWVDSHFMSPSKAKALELRKQAEELIKQAEELEGK